MDKFPDHHLFIGNLIFFKAGQEKIKGRKHKEENSH
jgi:hypothetical protein